MSFTMSRSVVLALVAFAALVLVLAVVAFASVTKSSSPQNAGWGHKQTAGWGHKSPMAQRAPQRHGSLT